MSKQRILKLHDIWLHLTSTILITNIFADAPHVLKLIRNWLIDTGFSLSDGTPVNYDPSWNLVVRGTNEI